MIKAALALRFQKATNRGHQRHNSDGGTNSTQIRQFGTENTQPVMTERKSLIQSNLIQQIVPLPEIIEVSLPFATERGEVELERRKAKKKKRSQELENSNVES